MSDAVDVQPEQVGKTEGTVVFRLEDYETTDAPPVGGAAAAAAPDPVADAYTDREIAELVGALSGFGLPLDALDGYSRAFVERAAPVLGLLQAGDALAELGITKGAGVGRAPAWLRALAAGVGLGVVMVVTRKQFAPAGEVSAGDWDSGLGSGGVVSDEGGQAHE